MTARIRSPAVQVLTRVINHGSEGRCWLRSLPGCCPGGGQGGSWQTGVCYHHPGLRLAACWPQPSRYATTGGGIPRPPPQHMARRGQGVTHIAMLGCEMGKIGKDAVVVGASIGGLLAARVLADADEKVTVTDRGSLPPDG